MPYQQRNFREQLAPIASKLREGRALIRPVSQVTVRLKPIVGIDRFANTVDDILRWLNNRAGRSLPDAAWQRKSFDLSDIGAQRTAAVSLTEPRYWAARLDDACKVVPLRTWITEIGVGLDTNGDVLFGTRLVCAIRGDDPRFDRSIPGFVRSILSTGNVLLDNESDFDKPQLVDSESDVEWLLRLLERPTRQSDVVVFSLADGSNDISTAVISPSIFCNRTFGVAHTVILTGLASFYLTEQVGKEFSVFRQGVRTYKPGFNARSDEPSRHPLALFSRILSWPDGGTKAFEQWLINQALHSSTFGPDREHRLPSFDTVRQLAAQLERDVLRRTGGSEADLLKLYEQDNDQLQTSIKEQKAQYDGLLETSDQEREAAVDDANAAKAQAFTLREQIRVLRQQLKEAPNQPAVPIPLTLEGFDEWCVEHLTGAVDVTNRASKGVRKSEYHDPSLIYKALLLLRDQYVPMRLEGGALTKTSFEQALEALQIEESGTGDGIKFNEDLYTVQYGGGRRALDRHLKKGGAHDSRFCFRAYFFWDEDARVVVVGWLPSHLDNRAT
jgi:hypothetical protein